MDAQLLSHVLLLRSPWTLAQQARLSTGLFLARILEWVVHFLLHGIFLTQGIKATSHASSALQADSLPLSHRGKPSVMDEHL